MLQKYNWKITYAILSGLLFVAGMLTSISFVKPGEAKSQNDEETPKNGRMKHKGQYDDLEKNQKDLSVSAKVLLGSLWFCASTLKAMGYYTPFLILVSIYQESFICR